MGVKVPSAGLLDALRVHLAHARWLVHIENVDSRELAEAVAPLVAHLSGCAIIVTGRFQGLGTSEGWRVLRLGLLIRSEAAELLAREAAAAPGIDVPSRMELDRLAERLGDLPLALHLAGGYLRIGLTVPEILQRLDDLGLQALDAADPAELPSAGQADARARRILASTFALSLACLERALGAAGLDPATGVAGLAALGWAPTAGVGAELAAAVTSLPPSDHRRLVYEAERLSLLERVPGRATEPAGPAVRLHPLLAEHLRTRPDAAAGRTRLTDWFVERLSERRDDPEVQGLAWRTLAMEHDGLAEWLASLPVEHIARVVSTYAIDNGPYAPWVALCTRGLGTILDDAVRSDLLFVLAHVLRRMGEFDRAERAALDLKRLARDRGSVRDAMQALAIHADILQDRGDHNEALRIQQHELLPIYEELGDRVNRAVTLGKIADNLQARGEFTEALRIRQEEELPAYKEKGAVHYYAATLGKIADIRLGGWCFSPKNGESESKSAMIPRVVFRKNEKSTSLLACGSASDLDEALQTLKREVLPFFEQRGAVRYHAVTLGKVADILYARGGTGDHDEALRILQQDVLPALKKIGAMRECAFVGHRIAKLLFARGGTGDHDEALRILQQDVLPGLEKPGNEHYLVEARANAALLLHREGNAAEAARLIRLALADAESLQHPELEGVRDCYRNICGDDPI